MRTSCRATCLALSVVITGCDLGSRTEETTRPAATSRPVLVARDSMIPVGQPAPDFEATDQEGHHVVLSDLLSTWNDVVLIFYPGDFTPGCTKQLCAVRDDWSKFKEKGAVVLGVNPGPVTRHADFAATYSLPFPLLHDEDADIASAYGAVSASRANPQRTVYVIHKDGNVALAERGMVPHDKIFAALQ